MVDADITPKHRAKDRRILGELYTKLHGSEEGLGALTLAAYDRTARLLAARHQKFLEMDPNLDAREPMDYVLSGVGDDRLEMKSLLGKVVVLDFWATWCKPCHAQQPLYEETKQRFADNQNVVFLNINTDVNRDVVAPFLAKLGWDKTVYFEDGLQRLLNVTSIPTTVIIGREGGVANRLNGFAPELFVDMLSERIDRALAAE